MKKIIVSLCVMSLIICSAFLKLEAVEPSNENILKDSTITANNEYYNGW